MVVKKESIVIKACSKVKLDYTGTLDDGKVFDSSSVHGKPLEFEVGAGKMIKGFESNVMGMKKGQEKEFVLNPAESYGEHNPNLMKKIPKEQLPKEHEPKPGMILVIGTQDGRKFPAVIKEVTDTEVTLDLNHPLAGKTLHFKIKVVEVS